MSRFNLVRLGAVLGLVGSTLFGSSLLKTGMAAFALPDAQVVQKLQSVPVFAIADAQGAPLVAAPGQGEKGSSVAGVFISQKDAQSFLDGLKTRNPELAKSVRVVPVSLGEVYQLERAGQNRPEKLEFAFVPVQQQVDLAVNLLRQSGQKVEQFNGVPLFIARGGQDNGYLTIQQGNQQVIPLFFEKEQLQALLENFKKQQPSLASTVNIQVVNLEGVIQTLQTSNKPELNQIVLIPSRESINFMQSLQQAPAGQNQPGVRPPAGQNQPGARPPAGQNRPAGR